MPKLHRLRDVDPVAIALCKKGANGQRIFLRKSEGALVTIASEMPLHKSAHPDWSALYCVVAQPNTRENGGMLDPDVVDVWDSPEEIRKAAHRMLKNRGVVNVEHGDAAEAHIVESAVALAPIPLDDITVPAGAWYVGIEPSAELRKAYDSGELTGVSLEGTGVREAAVEIEDEPQRFLKRLADALGLRDRTGTLGSESPDEENDVDTAKLIEEVEGIKKSQTAATTAIAGLVTTVDRLMTHFEDDAKRRAKQEKKDDDGEGGEATSPADLKKAIDELTDTVNGKLDEFDAEITKLADPGSHQRDDIKKKQTSDDPLAGILD